MPAGAPEPSFLRAFEALGRVLAKPPKTQRPVRLKPIRVRTPGTLPAQAVPRRPGRADVMTRHQLYEYFKRIGKLDLFFYIVGR